MEKDGYYDGTKLLSLLDLDGNKPEIYFCTTNRTGGKTTYFSRLCVNRFKDSGSKFMVVYRFKYELDDCADKFFKDIRELFFPNDVMESQSRSDGVYHELLLNNIPCGYAVALNSADILKKMSHFFSDVDRMFMDEFMPESYQYCVNEITKYKSLHTTVARGRGKQVRYVPVYMCANPLTLLNPYYEAMGISNRLSKKTKFLRGHGYVLEQGFVETAYNAQKESGFNKAFIDDRYVAYGKEGIYLDDDVAFIEKPEGKSRYLATLRYEGCDYAIREFPEFGIIYCDNKPDRTFPLRIAVTTDDHQLNYVMLKNNDLFLSNMRYYFRNGCFRFRDLGCRRAVLSCLGY